MGIDPGIGTNGFGLVETNDIGGLARALDFGVVTTVVDASKKKS